MGSEAALIHLFNSFNLFNFSPDSPHEHRGSSSRMNFLAPAAFAFAAAVPIVIVFYLLKRKRVVHLVSSTLLWQKFLAETQASSPFQRLRHNWLLILQILVLLLAIFALMRPYLAGEGKSGR